MIEIPGELTMRIAGTVSESVVDGPGLRLVVFAQGCMRACPQCHNPGSHDPGGGEEAAVDALAAVLSRARLIRGVTFSGGEPFLQARSFAALGNLIKKPGLDLLTYTGYTFEELLNGCSHEEGWRALLEVTDLLVDGPFEIERRDLGLPYRGSANQRVLDMRRSLTEGRAILAAGY